MTAPAGAARARVAPAVAALAVLALFLHALAGPSAARAMGMLPVCRYDDVLTTPRDYADWPVTLVDTILRVPASYVPPDLVPVTDAGIAGKGERIRAVAIDDLRAMAAAAKAAGATIGVESAYRSYTQQARLFDADAAAVGYDAALAKDARPGHSEHQLGLAIDFRSVPRSAPHSQLDWATTPAGQWMAVHAWQYGWLSSYPAGDRATSCYAYEPWHYRYVGRALAARIHAAQVTIREYLWTGFTTTVVPFDGQPPAWIPATPGALQRANLAADAATVPVPAPYRLGPATATTAAAAAAVLEATTAPISIAAGTAPPLADASSGPEPAATLEPEAATGVDAGQAVVFGALAIVAAAIAGGWLAGRRRTGALSGGPPSR
jgi:D-alanyl-D-alanine carboxypeptidase